MDKTESLDIYLKAEILELTSNFEDKSSRMGNPDRDCQENEPRDAGLATISLQLSVIEQKTECFIRCLDLPALRPDRFFLPSHFYDFSQDTYCYLIRGLSMYIESNRGMNSL